MEQDQLLVFQEHRDQIQYFQQSHQQEVEVEQLVKEFQQHKPQEFQEVQEEVEEHLHQMLINQVEQVTHHQQVHRKEIMVVQDIQILLLGEEAEEAEEQVEQVQMLILQQALADQVLITQYQVLQ